MLACDMTLNFSERAFNAARVVIDRLMTVEHVAKSYKVSRQAVSFAIDVVTNSTKEMIQAVCCGKVPLRIAAGLLKRPESEQTDAIQNGRMKLAVERKKNPTIAERFSCLFDQFKNEIKALARGSKELIELDSVTSKIAAYISSCACDLSPIVAVGKGVLFGEEDKDIQDSRRQKPTEKEFENFYAAFPRRVNKAKSKVAFEKAFKTLRKTKSPEDAIKTIMDGVRVYAKNANPDALCHPTTWLNGCRWEDDPDAIGTKPTTSKRTSAASYGQFSEADRKMTLEEKLRRINQ